MDTASLGLTSSITINSGSVTGNKLADGTYRVSSNFVLDANNNTVGKVSDKKVYVDTTATMSLTSDNFENGSLITISGNGSKFSVKGKLDGDALQMAPGRYETKGSNLLKDGNIVGKVSGNVLVVNKPDGSTIAVSGKELGILSAAVASGMSFTINGVDASTRNTAMGSITSINDAIENVSKERAKLGAYQNRLEHTIANLGTSAENLTAAESRVRDVDMAKEMMTFSKNNILAQAAQAMLAQANQQPQGVLQLLR